MKQVRIAIALPASGKTTFYKGLAGKDRSFALLSENAMISFDTQFNECDRTRSRPMRDQEYVARIRDYSGFYGTLLIDGLFLSTERIMHVLDQVFEHNTVEEVIFDYWPENRENCLRNDYKRRRQGSALSINSLSINVDFEFLKSRYMDKTNVKIEEHQTYYVPDYVLFFRDRGLTDLPDERYLDSDSWIIGGRVRNAESEWFSADKDDAPSQFKELEELLCRVSEDFPLPLYVKIKQSCVKTIEYEESDYYSVMQKQFFRCDLALLWEFLCQAGYAAGFEAETQKEDEFLPCSLCRSCIHFKDGLHEPICRDCVRNGFQEFFHKDDTRQN